MSKNKPQKPQQKPQQSPETQTATVNARKNKRPKSTYISVAPKFSGFLVRMSTDVVESLGKPCDPDGTPMILRPPGIGNSSPEAKALRLKKKADEEARFAALSDEEKLAFAQEKRLVAKRRREDKRAKQRDAMIAQIKAEIKAGTLTL